MKNINDYTFKELLEQKFGDNFKISFNELYNFINDLLKDDFSIDIVYKDLLGLYRDDYIDYYDLKKILDMLELPLVNEFSFYSEKAKEVIREISKKVNNETELLNYLYNYYYNLKIDFKTYEVACLLMGYFLKEEFSKLDDEERKNKFWCYDQDNNPVILSEASAELFKNINTFRYVEDNELLYPNISYRYPMDFAFDYMDQNNIDDKVLTKGGLDRRKKSKMAHSSNINKIEVFRLIFLLNMPTVIAKQFLNIAGYSFSPLQSEDLFFLNYLNGKYKKVDTLEELDELAIKNGVEITKDFHFKYPYWK